ncbi:helix-turn-helix domain-containing protein [Actinomadura terrae]|uniref:helix-turn-helix domain-containing protein n=1 Tax=Actinomadura terrae TaxID=604353 RepID=UPI001FA6B710|nr:helix-turn-helix domain-containing protein [Actinomadura terrae]
MDDEYAALFTVGQVADMLQVRQAFLRRIDAQQVVSPQRSTGGQRRYSRAEIGRIQEVVSMMDRGMSLPAIRRIFELQLELREITRERDELAHRLAAHTACRPATDSEAAPSDQSP